MGTRGAIGFFKNDKHKATYNHFDSYLSGLGQQMLEMVNLYTIEELNEMYDKIELIDKDASPTNEQKEKCKFSTDLNVASQSDDDWYCLLRNAQGKLDKYCEIGLMIDNANFLKDSLFCEFAYIMNLDDNILEIYKGFQHSKPNGRYADDPPNEDGYYAVSLVKTYPLDDCPAEFDENAIKEIKGSEEE